MMKEKNPAKDIRRGVEKAERAREEKLEKYAEENSVKTRDRKRGITGLKKGRNVTQASKPAVTRVAEFEKAYQKNGGK